MLLQPVRLPQRVVVGQAVVTTALDVEGAQVQTRNVAGGDEQEGAQVLGDLVVQLQGTGRAQIPVAINQSINVQ